MPVAVATPAVPLATPLFSVTEPVTSPVICAASPNMKSDASITPADVFCRRSVGLPEPKPTTTSLPSGVTVTPANDLPP